MFPAERIMKSLNNIVILILEITLFRTCSDYKDDVDTNSGNITGEFLRT